MKKRGAFYKVKVFKGNTRIYRVIPIKAGYEALLDRIFGRIAGKIRKEELKK